MINIENCLYFQLVGIKESLSYFTHFDHANHWDSEFFNVFNSIRITNKRKEAGWQIILSLHMNVYMYFAIILELNFKTHF